MRCLAFFVATVLTLAAPVSAQEVEDLRWSPAKSMEFRVIQQTAVSPDGSLVAFVVRVPVMEGEKSEYLSHIWLANADGSAIRQFTRGEKSATSPSFSPDGRWLAFSSSRGGENQVWVIPVSGGEASQVTAAESGAGSFSWSPDGSRLAYLMVDPETEEEKLRKTEKRDPIFVDQNFKYAHIYVAPFDPDASEAAEATRVTEGQLHITNFDWSPDGMTFAFAHQADPRLDEGARASDISMVSVDGGGAVRPLVTLGGTDGSPRFSPDGRWVAFTSSGDTPERVGLSDVYVVAASGGEPRRLADSHDRSGGLMDWS